MPRAPKVGRKEKRQVLREVYGVRLRKYAHERIIVPEKERTGQRYYKEENSGKAPPLRPIINSAANVGNVLHLRNRARHQAIVCQKDNAAALEEAARLPPLSTRSVVYSLERVDAAAMDAVRACQAPLCLGGVAPLCVAVTDKSPVWFWQPQWSATAYPCHGEDCRKTCLVASHFVCAACGTSVYCSTQCWARNKRRHTESGECEARARVMYREDKSVLKYFPTNRYGTVTFRSQT